MANKDSKIRKKRSKKYQAPKLLDSYRLEALAVSCTDANAKQDVAFGCNPGALFS